MSSSDRHGRPGGRRRGGAVQRECVEAKEALSDDTRATVGVYLPDRSEQVRITRSELEHRIRPALGETIAALRRALSSAGVAAEQVDRVLLVGGSSRIPLVAELVGAELGRPVAVDSHPKHTVALGAARLAGTAVPTDRRSGAAAAGPVPAAAAAAPAAVGPATGGPTAAAPARPGRPEAPAQHNAAPMAAAQFSSPRPAAPPTEKPEPDLAPTPARAGTSAQAEPPAKAVSRRSPRRTGVLVAVATAALLVVGAVAWMTLGGDGGEGAGVDLVSFTAERAGDGTCTAAWDFNGSFQEGDQLWLLWRGTVVARGAASRANQVAAAVGFDQLQLVRNGQAVQSWQPRGAGC